MLIRCPSSSSQWFQAGTLQLECQSLLAFTTFIIFKSIKGLLVTDVLKCHVRSLPLPLLIHHLVMTHCGEAIHNYLYETCISYYKPYQRNDEELAHFLDGIGNVFHITCKSAHPSLFQFYVATYMDNDIVEIPQVLQKSGHPIKAICACLKGKKGHLCGN